MRIGFTFLGVGILAYLLFEVKFIHAMLAAFMICIFAAATDIITSGLFNQLGIDTTVLMNSGFMRSMYLIVDHIFLFALILAVCLINHQLPNALSRKSLLPVLPCWISSLLLCCLVGLQFLQTENGLPFLYILVMLGLLYTNILFVYYANRISVQAQRQKELELAAQHYTMQQQYYNQLLAQQEETRALWHDIHKYIRASQIESGNQSWEQLQAKFNAITNVVEVNNSIVNIILTEYLQKAKAAHTKLQLAVSVPPELPVTAADLYIIIGNTFDNALDACRELPEDKRIIVLKLKKHNSILYYEIRNPYLEEHLLKERGPFHGYGLKNVSRCLNKYKGHLLTKKENGIFCVSTHLNLTSV
jgi:hypothetical protein